MSHFISRRMSLSPDWKGIWKNWQSLGRPAQALISLSVKYLQAAATLICDREARPSD